MAQWLDFADSYLKLAERAVLTHAGTVSHDRMLTVIDERYATFDASRKETERQAAEIEYECDVEAELKQIEAAATQSKRRVGK